MSKLIFLENNQIITVSRIRTFSARVTINTHLTNNDLKVPVSFG